MFGHKFSERHGPWRGDFLKANFTYNAEGFDTEIIPGGGEDIFDQFWDPQFGATAGYWPETSWDPFGGMTQQGKFGGGNLWTTKYGGNYDPFWYDPAWLDIGSQDTGMTDPNTGWWMDPNVPILYPEPTLTPQGDPFIESPWWMQEGTWIEPEDAWRYMGGRPSGDPYQGPGGYIGPDEYGVFHDPNARYQVTGRGTADPEYDPITGRPTWIEPPYVPPVGPGLEEPPILKPEPPTGVKIIEDLRPEVPDVLKPPTPPKVQEPMPEPEKRKQGTEERKKTTKPEEPAKKTTTTGGGGTTTQPKKEEQKKNDALGYALLAMQPNHPYPGGYAPFVGPRPMEFLLGWPSPTQLAGPLSAYLKRGLG